MHGCINTCFANEEIMVDDRNVVFSQLDVYIIVSLLLLERAFEGVKKGIIPNCGQSVSKLAPRMKE